ncbi:hypothetical protein VP01_3143g3 [Puccinia sorghi]|uniref:Uncharacterized protein n=1 Tax=Puccinia sorghi TaxID=27349 RepID=A0A0L6UYY7_9BASI|nr:hypothetical protein VP01_3143g3 [Puccinia sorghi]
MPSAAATAETRSHPLAYISSTPSNPIFWWFFFIPPNDLVFYIEMMFYFTFSNIKNILWGFTEWQSIFCNAPTVGRDLGVKSHLFPLNLDTIHIFTFTDFETPGTRHKVNSICTHCLSRYKGAHFYLMRRIKIIILQDQIRIPGCFCCYSNHSPKLIQPIFDAQSLCILHNDCAKKSTYSNMELGWQLGWSMLHVNCRQLSKFFFEVLKMGLKSWSLNRIDITGPSSGKKQLCETLFGHKSQNFNITFSHFVSLLFCILRIISALFHRNYRLFSSYYPLFPQLLFHDTKRTSKVAIVSSLFPIFSASYSVFLGSYLNILELVSVSTVLDLASLYNAPLVFCGIFFLDFSSKTYFFHPAFMREWLILTPPPIF